MSDTLSTLRKEWLSEKTDELDAQIDAARVTRDNALDNGNYPFADTVDKFIDDLLARKECLLDECPFPSAAADDYTDGFCDERLDNGLRDDAPYRPAKPFTDDDLPF